MTYTPNNRLASAAGAYGTFAWTYDGNGNRLSETANGVTSAYAYPSNSNLLAAITPSGLSPRSFAYDASGNTASDTRNGALGLSFTYDENGRLSQAYQTNNPLEGATYTYDARSRLASRTLTHAVAPTSSTTAYIHDIRDHIIAETDANGVTQREYIWLDELPVAVIERNGKSSALYYVHTDHLFRPVAMTDANWNIVWSVSYEPFGAVATIHAPTATLDLRFPGQWFQLETGLHYNWHRHYDPTAGRYLQPDPLINDDGAMSFDGLSTALTGMTSAAGTGTQIADAFGRIRPDAFLPTSSARTMFPDGPSVFGYARQSPLTKTDPQGTQTLPLPWAAPCLANPYCAGALAAATVGALICERTFSGGGGGSNDNNGPCEQQAQADEAVCRSLPNSTPAQRAVRARCWDSSAARYGACRAGKPLPPLITW